MDSLREFDSSVVILRSIATKNPYSCLFTIPAFQARGPQPWPAQARKHPAVAGRAPQLRPNPRQTYFVILNEAKNLFPCEPKAACGLCLAMRRKTNEVQSRICLRILDTDSSSIFRSSQNDNAVFALNHFRSGTHSSARPGRLRGARFQREPAPGARSSISEREQILRDMLAIIVNFAF